MNNQPITKLEILTKRANNLKNMSLDEEKPIRRKKAIRLWIEVLFRINEEINKIKSKNK